MPKRFARPLMVLGAAVALVLAGAVGAAAESYLRPAKWDNKIAIRGCVIRFDQKTPEGFTQPRIHANSAHICVGVTKVYADRANGDLVVEDNTPGPIVSLAVSPDESLAAKGISCGGSGGTSVTRIRCYGRDGHRVSAHSSEIYGPYNNLWLTWFTWQDA